ncbi:MAG: HipA N-terminal domain-containing protein [Candidatus Omnitrophica bacterium]|nr:HipA N-terminal domain-containing protein [Candidatus Omnitrophota bacterium]
MRYKNKNLKIIAVNVFLEKRKTMVYVGQLTRENKGYRFVYKKNYLHAEAAIPLGNEMRLTRQERFSKTLFPSLVDRIPSRENPSYSDYCKSVGIEVTEEDPLVLLSTIGRRGPSSFIFEPVYDRGFNGDMCKMFRIDLGLTVREFSGVFDVATATVMALEQGKKSGSGKEVLKRLEIYCMYPGIALDEVFLRGGVLHESKRRRVVQILRNRKKQKGDGYISK